MNENIDTLWIDYTDFNQNNGHFDGDDFIRKSKYIQEGNSCLWHQKYYLTCTKALVFLARRVISKILVIGAVECY